MLLQFVEVRSKPVLDSDRDSFSFESHHDLLIAVDVSLGEGVFDVGEERVIVYCLQEVVT